MNSITKGIAWKHAKLMVIFSPSAIEEAQMKWWLTALMYGENNSYMTLCNLRYKANIKVDKMANI